MRFKLILQSQCICWHIKSAYESKQFTQLLGHSECTGFFQTQTPFVIIRSNAQCMTVLQQTNRRQLHYTFEHLETILRQRLLATHNTYMELFFHHLASFSSTSSHYPSIHNVMVFQHIYIVEPMDHLCLIENRPSISFFSHFALHYALDLI